MRAILFIVVIAVAGVMATPLPRFNARLNATTVGGLSSGAFFSVQMHVAFSSAIRGAAIFAGYVCAYAVEDRCIDFVYVCHCSGQYDCSQDSETTALTTCMLALPSPPSAATAIQTTDSRAQSGAIDQTSNLADSYVYLFTGKQDGTVKKPVMDALQQFYAYYIASPSQQLTYVTTVSATHTQPTDDSVSGFNPCGISESPFISDCSYDGAGAAFKQIFQFTGQPLNARNDGTLSGQIISFDQSLYTNGTDPSSISLANTGYAYVPQSCSNAATECYIHLSFHGCEQDYGSIGDMYVANAGYNAWADTNNIVVIYPQTTSMQFTNPNACWDWWGYSGSNYDEQTGSQMQFAWNIMNAVTNH